MSILSDRTDGMGYFYGFMAGDHRQINVRRHTCPDGFIQWRAWVGGEEIGKFDTKGQAETGAIEWARANPEPVEAELLKSE